GVRVRGGRARHRPGASGTSARAGFLDRGRRDCRDDWCLAPAASLPTNSRLNIYGTFFEASTPCIDGTPLVHELRQVEGRKAWVDSPGSGRVTQEEWCRKQRPSSERERTLEKGNRHRRKPGSSCARRSTTFATESTAHDPQSRTL